MELDSNTSAFQAAPLAANQQTSNVVSIPGAMATPAGSSGPRKVVQVRFLLHLTNRLTKLVRDLLDMRSEQRLVMRGRANPGVPSRFTSGQTSAELAIQRIPTYFLSAAIHRFCDSVRSDRPLYVVVPPSEPGHTMESLDADLASEMVDSDLPLNDSQFLVLTENARQLREWTEELLQDGCLSYPRPNHVQLADMQPCASVDLDTCVHLLTHATKDLQVCIATLTAFIAGAQAKPSRLPLLQGGQLHADPHSGDHPTMISFPQTGCIGRST